jgi:hypothetical protein
MFEIAAACLASEKMFGLRDVPPIGALADERAARAGAVAVEGEKDLSEILLPREQDLKML